MSGWLAVGAVIAALGAPRVGPLAIILATASAALIVVAVAPRSRGDGRVRSACLLLIGCGLIAARLVIASPAAPIAGETPAGKGPWTAVVESIGAVRDGSQVATLRLIDSPGTRVAATLPRYPEIEPGLDVVVDGAIRAPPDGPYGDYLERTGIAGTLQSRRLDIKGSEGVV